MTPISFFEQLAEKLFDKKEIVFKSAEQFDYNQ